MKRKVKQFVVPTIYILAICTFTIGMYAIGVIFNINKFNSDEDMEYVDKEIVTDNEYIPVVIVENTIMYPYINGDVSINKKFYDINSSEEEQEKAIIIYEGTYMQNSGIDYKSNSQFDVVSILDGTVIEITENNILGKTIKIRHSNDLVSVYQSLSETNINVDDQVTRGQIIGKSGTCALYSKDNNLHFEIFYQGKNINPEIAYNKTENELQA